MTSLTLNTMNPIGEEESCSSLGELLLLFQRFSSLVEISSYLEDFLFIFEGGHISSARPRSASIATSNSKCTRTPQISPACFDAWFSLGFIVFLCAG